jgi:asparagine synthetase B (glutamine-hydrolysing)
LSGGLDSSIAAWLARRVGVECEAFTVWFDCGSGIPPPDLAGARLTAEALRTPLHELRVGPEDIEALAREAVYLIEESYWRHVETATYVLRLVSELKRQGYGCLMTGLGGDGNFAGMIFRRQLGEGFQAGMAANRRHRFALSQLAPTLGIDLISPFDYVPLSEFTLTLPAAYLVEEIDGKLRGKKILRELYAHRMASRLCAKEKDFPFNTAGSEALYATQWGSREERELRYAKWMDELLPIPRMGGGSTLTRLFERLRRD